MQQTAYDQLISRASQFIDKPGVKNNMAELTARWEEVERKTDERSRHLQKALTAWETFEELSNRVEELANDADQQVALQTTAHRGIEMETVDRQLVDCRVRNDVYFIFNYFFLNKAQHSWLFVPLEFRITGIQYYLYFSPISIYHHQYLASESSIISM